MVFPVKNLKSSYIFLLRTATLFLMALCANKLMESPWVHPLVLLLQTSYPPTKNLGLVIVLPISSSVTIVDMLMIVFLLFRSPDYIPLFLSFLYRQHPNINFTFETESNRSLPFLDININGHNGTLTTSVYHKPTFTGLFTNFHSFIPFIYKQGLILSLLHRCFSICSSYGIFHKELEMLKNIFKLNGFVTHLFDKWVSIFLDKTFTTKSVLHTVPIKVLYFSLPFTGFHSLQIRIQILKLCSSAYPHIRIRFVFQPGKRLAHLFNFKDRILNVLRSCVVNS